MQRKWTNEDHALVRDLRNDGMTFKEIAETTELPISSVHASYTKSQQSTPEGSNSLQLRVEELETTLNSMQDVVLYMGNKMRSELERARQDSEERGEVHGESFKDKLERLKREKS